MRFNRRREKQTLVSNWTPLLHFGVDVYVLVSVLVFFQYFDYVSKVLLPEALAKICMDVHGISHQDAVKFLAETQSASFCM